jgi:hypothetical protein
MPIWFIIDLDVEFDNERFGKPYNSKNPGIEKGIPLFLSIFKEFQIPATFHIQEQADVHDSISARYPNILEAIQEGNHEIGLHVHFEKGYDSESREREISSGIRRLEEKCGKIVSFRAGKYFTSEDTIKILEKYGIKHDTSPYKNTSIGNMRWYDIPDSPYHPSYEDITKIGNAKILMIPITNKRLGVILDSSIPLELMKKGTKILISESEKIKQPIIIFLSTHSWKFIDPVTNNFRKDIIQRLKEYFEFLQQFNNIEFMNVKTLGERWEQGEFTPYFLDTPDLFGQNFSLFSPRRYFWLSKYFLFWRKYFKYTLFKKID